MTFLQHHFPTRRNMQPLLKLFHAKNLSSILKLHLLICESDCQNLGLNFKMHRVAIFIIQLDNTIEIWSFIIMLTRKALIVHCVTSPPLRQSACSGRTVAQRKRGTDWRMTLNLHLAKRQIFKQISKNVPETERTKMFLCCGILWCFC